MWSGSSASRTLGAALATAWLLGAGTAQAAPGDLDPAYGIGGIAPRGDDVSGYGPETMATMPDGSAITIGGIGAFQVERTTAAGKADAGFADGGQVRVDLPGTEQALTVAAAPDGKIIAAGETGVMYPDRDGVVVRLLPDGRLDPEFGNDGIVMIDLGATESVADVAVRADGAVAAVGTRTDYPSSASRGFVAQLEPDGDLDSSFSGDGYADDLDGDATRSDQANAVEVAANGDVVIAITKLGPPAYAQQVVRLLADGAHDPSFAGDGAAEFDPPLAGFTRDLELDGSGATYLFTGGSTPSGSSFGLVVKLGPTGKPDPGFGADGHAISDLTFSGGGEIDGQGGVVVAGERPGGGSDYDYDVELRRLMPSGERDTSFGGDGIVTTDLNGRGSLDGAKSLDIDPQGRLVLSASAFPAGYLARYLNSPGPADADADGLLDAADSCPNRYGAGHRGCPVRRPVTLSISYVRAVDDFQGLLSFGDEQPCADGARVVVYRKRPGPDRRIGKSPPTSPGSIPGVYPDGDRVWGVSALRRAGRYYAIVKRRLLPDWGICGSDRSPVKTIVPDR